MRVTIFGATGQIGSILTRLSIEKGYEVTVYVRNAGKLTVPADKLRVIEGELTEYDKISDAVRGADAVINAIGIPVSRKYKGTHCSDGTKLIIKAMKEHGVKRYIGWSTVSVKFDKDEKSFITTVPGVMIGLAMPNAKEELIRVATVVKESGLDWTMVRYMLLTDGPLTGKYKICFGKGSRGLRISRNDVADFMMKQLESREYIQSMPIITM